MATFFHPEIAYSHFSNSLLLISFVSLQSNRHAVYSRIIKCTRHLAKTCQTRGKHKNYIWAKEGGTQHAFDCQNIQHRGEKQTSKLCFVIFQLGKKIHIVCTIITIFY